MDAASTWSVETDPYARIPHALIEDLELPHTAVRVYGYLMRRADNETTESFPGYRRIASEIGMSTATIAKCIEALEQRGWIDVTRSKGAGGRQNTNHYFVRRTRRGVAVSDTPVADSETRRVAESKAELEPSLSKTKELNLATQNVAWDFYTDPSGFNLPTGTAKQQRRVGALAREVNAILESNHVAVPEQMNTLQQAALSWPLHFGSATLTPDAFEKHLPALLKAPLRGSDNALAEAEQAQAFAALEEQYALEEQ